MIHGGGWGCVWWCDTFASRTVNKMKTPVAARVCPPGPGRERVRRPLLSLECNAARMARKKGRGLTRCSPPPPFDIKVCFKIYTNIKKCLPQNVSTLFNAMFSIRLRHRIGEGLKKKNNRWEQNGADESTFGVWPLSRRLCSLRTTCDN
jgi:hypothetical protein